MKKSTKTIIAICGLVVSVVIVLLFFARIFDIGASKEQMDSAKKYMDSLTDKDIQAWIQRAKRDLKNDDPKAFATKDAPPDLQQLGMTGIEEDSNYIDYIWFGGMDYTALEIKRMSNEDFQVVAIYTPYSNRVIWPK
jgi:hypothetical protein